MLKILKLRAESPLSPLIVRVEDPGPVMVRVPADKVVTIEGNAELSVMVPVTPEKMMSSEVEAAFALMIACLREPTPKSLLFVTVKVAGVILSSRPMSSSLREIALDLILKVCFLLPNSFLKIFDN